VKEVSALADELRNNPKYNSQLKELVKAMQTEMGMQNTLMQAFGEKDVTCWMEEINKLNSTTGTRSEQLMNKRLLAYLGIMAYMMSNKMIDEKNIDAAEKSLTVYRLVEPSNPEHAYLEAKRRMLMNEPGRAVEYLQLAMILGLDDTDRIKNDPAFASLSGNSDFVKLFK
jgi:hypothetical protein